MGRDDGWQQRSRALGPKELLGMPNTVCIKNIVGKSTGVSVFSLKRQSF